MRILLFTHRGKPSTWSIPDTGSRIWNEFIGLVQGFLLGGEALDSYLLRVSRRMRLTRRFPILSLASSCIPSIAHPPIPKGTLPSLFCCITKLIKLLQNHATILNGSHDGDAYKNTKHTQKNKKYHQKMSFSVTHFWGGGPKIPFFWQLGPKNAHPQNTIKFGVSANQFLKNRYASRNGHFWTNKKPKFQLFCLPFSSLSTTKDTTHW